jgi:predicted RNA-binding Zn ribbon-like protein
MPSEPLPEAAGRPLTRHESIELLVELLNRSRDELVARPGDLANTTHDFKRWARVVKGSDAEATIDAMGKTPDAIHAQLEALGGEVRRYLAGHWGGYREHAEESVVGVRFARQAGGRALVVHEVPLRVALCMRLGEDLASEEASGLRQCPRETCRRFFVGRPNKTYCSQPCANREAARRHRVLTRGIVPELPRDSGADPNTALQAIDAPSVGASARPQTTRAARFLKKRRRSSQRPAALKGTRG